MQIPILFLEKENFHSTDLLWVKIHHPLPQKKKSLHLKTSQQWAIGQQAQPSKGKTPQEVFQQSTAVRVTFQHDFRESFFSTVTWRKIQKGPSQYADKKLPKCREESYASNLWTETHGEISERVCKFCLGSTLKLFLDYWTDKHMCSTLCEAEGAFRQSPITKKAQFLINKAHILQTWCFEGVPGQAWPRCDIWGLCSYEAT